MKSHSGSDNRLGRYASAPSGRVATTATAGKANARPAAAVERLLIVLNVSEPTPRPPGRPYGMRAVSQDDGPPTSLATQFGLLDIGVSAEGAVVVLNQQPAPPSTPGAATRSPCRLHGLLPASPQGARDPGRPTMAALMPSTQSRRVETPGCQRSSSAWARVAFRLLLRFVQSDMRSDSGTVAPRAGRRRDARIRSGTVGTRQSSTSPCSVSQSHPNPAVPLLVPRVASDPARGAPGAARSRGMLRTGGTNEAQADRLVAHPQL